MVEFDNDKAAIDRMSKNYVKYQRYYYKVVSSMMKNRFDTEDVLHDSLVNAYASPRLASLSDEEILPWFTTICKNTAKNAIASRSRCVPTDDVDSGKESTIDTSFTVEDEIRSLLCRLPNRIILALESVFFMNVSVRVASKTYNVPISTLYYHRTSILKKIACIYGKKK